MVSALQKILDWAIFIYNFRLSPQEGSRIKVFLSDCVRAGRLTTGTWQKKVWISFMIMDRMASAYITHHLDHGARNWDIIAARMMSVVLIAGIGCRAGDVTRAAMWDGVQFLQWQHVDLTFEDTDTDGDREPCFENLRAHIVLEYTKGHKDKTNETLDIKRRSKFSFFAIQKEGITFYARLLFHFSTDLINFLFFISFLLFFTYSFIFIMTSQNVKNVPLNFSNYKFEKLITHKAVKDIAFKSLKKIIEATQRDKYLSKKDFQLIEMK